MWTALEGEDDVAADHGSFSFGKSLPAHVRSVQVRYVPIRPERA